MSTRNSGRIQLVLIFIVALFLLVFCVISSTAALRKSPTYDEPVHLFAGYSYLK
jgi:hypothetical protein